MTEPVESPTKQTAPAWSRGWLEIHQLATGRGNCALIIAPDGTSYVVDVGESHREARSSTAPKPDGSRRPGEWAARYIARHLPEGRRDRIDYLIATHLHGDHIGEVGGENGVTGPTSADGSYVLTGITDLAQHLETGTLVDRAFPSYDYPQPLEDPTATNYRNFVRARVRGGGSVARIEVGSTDQLAPRTDPQAFPDFSVRGLAANGVVWAGSGNHTRNLFPDLDQLRPDQYPTENMCSLALLFSYGAFRFYTGGDLPFATADGAESWRDIETPVARAAGPVDVAVLNHHGYVDADGPEFVRALRPQVFVVPGWDSCHPTIEVLARLLSRRLYPDDRQVLVTNMMAENRIVNRRLDECGSDEGHIVVRVAPGGSTFEVDILDNSDEEDRLLKTFGPYQSGRARR